MAEGRGVRRPGQPENDLLSRNRFAGENRSMMRRVSMASPWAVAGLVLLSMVGAGAAEMPFVHPLFTDHMMLQREAAAPVWGWTTPGASCTAT